MGYDPSAYAERVRRLRAGLSEKEALLILDEKNIRHLIRYSGTENKLRILLECKDAKKMNTEMDSMVEFFQKVLNA